MTLTTDRIRALNDELRRSLPNGHAVMTTGVAALGPEAVARIIKTIAVYDDFCHANDPHEEHDFGSFEIDGAVIFFKIDYFDKNLTYHSPDPANPSVTERVITIMLADRHRDPHREHCTPKYPKCPLCIHSECMTRSHAQSLHK
jgi:hypothetical protein